MTAHVVNHETLRLKQARTMADAERLRLLALILTDPRGQTSIDGIAGPGMDKQEIVGHIEAMANVGLLARADTTDGPVFFPTPDALARFGSTALYGGPPPGLGAVDSDHAEILRRISVQIADRFADVFAPETVSRYIDESYRLLAERATVRQYLPALTARFATDRLAALAEFSGARHGHMHDVLFVCVHNSGRSQIAAAVTRSLGAGSIRVRTAGSSPAGEMNVRVRAELARRGLDGLTDFPRPLTDDVVRASDVVVTLGCGDACPVFPGRRYVNWSVRDPADLDNAGISTVVDDITVRVRTLLGEVLGRS